MRIHFIEFHDAELVELCFLEGDLTLRFGHISLFEKLAEDEFAVWSFTGVLKVKDVRDIHLQMGGPLPQDVVDLEVDGSYPAVDDTPRLLLNTAARSLHFLLRDGSDVRCGCSGVHFDVGTKGARMKDWIGPLTGN